MRQVARKLFPYLALLLLASALLWAISFGRLPKADFTFNNGDEIQTVDPPMATGAPEGRIINALFEGLLRMLPAGEKDADGNVPMRPTPAMAKAMPEISEDGKTYTFKIRETAKWSNGEPVTAHDFVWSWRRMLFPATGSEYAYQLHYIRGAKKYNTSQLAEGDKVEVELDNRPNQYQIFPRGTVLHGVLKKIIKPPPLKLSDKLSAEEKEDKQAEHKAKRAFVVEVKGGNDEPIDWEKPGEVRAFSIDPSPKETAYRGKIEKCLNVLINFETEVAIHAVDERTLVLELNSPTHFFNELLAFYPLYPVNRRCVEQFGAPKWTKPQNIVNNGPFLLEFRRIRDRIRLSKNPYYWNAEKVHLETVDALAIKSETTSLNMYLNNQLDWSTTVPNALIPKLKKRQDFITAPALIAYFYRINVNKKSLDNMLVRRALNMAIDKQLICDKITKAGQTPAATFAPPVLSGLTGYQPPRFADMQDYDVRRVRSILQAAEKAGKAEDESHIKQLLAQAGYPGSPQYVSELLKRARSEPSADDRYPDINWMKHDIDDARRLLELAGYPNGQGLPKISILYNTSEAHRAIAEVIQQQWKQLGVDVELKNTEWATFLDSLKQKDFYVARSGWIGDYSDPNTFIDMFVTDGANNQTNWGNARYDEIITDLAPKEPIAEKRLSLLKEAEMILMAEQPIAPIYFYVSINMIKPRVRGFSPNIQDLHPLHILRVDDKGLRVDDKGEN